MALTTSPLKAADKAVNWLNRDRLFRLYSDPKGRALLIRASTLKEGSPALKELTIQIPRILAAQEASAPNVTPFRTAPQLQNVAQNQDAQQ